MTNHINAGETRQLDQERIARLIRCIDTLRQTIDEQHAIIVRLNAALSEVHQHMVHETGDPVPDDFMVVN